MLVPYSIYVIVAFSKNMFFLFLNVYIRFRKSSQLLSLILKFFLAQHVILSNKMYACFRKTRVI